MDSESVALPTAVIKEYESYLQRESTVTVATTIAEKHGGRIRDIPRHLKGDGDACIPWHGHHRMPSRPKGPRVPVIIHEMDVYDAAKVAYAIEHGTGYPLLWYRMTCNNLWCVNGKHVTLVERSLSGRATKSLEQTTRYVERYELITQWLKEQPSLTQYEILAALRERNLGGKTYTVARILARVRHEMGLPARVPSRRKKHS